MFPITIETKCPNISRIHPLKQRQVSKIYTALHDFDEVKRAYIFGSSTTGKCHIGSDLDICIDADTSDGLRMFELHKVIGDICDWNFDILMYNSIGSRLREIIDREGVVIYESIAK